MEQQVVGALLFLTLLAGCVTGNAPTEERPTEEAPATAPNGTQLPFAEQMTSVNRAIVNLWHAEPFAAYVAWRYPIGDAQHRIDRTVAAWVDGEPVAMELAATQAFNAEVIASTDHGVIAVGGHRNAGVAGGGAIARLTEGQWDYERPFIWQQFSPLAGGFAPDGTLFVLTGGPKGNLLWTESALGWTPIDVPGANAFSRGSMAVLGDDAYVFGRNDANLIVAWRYDSSGVLQGIETLDVAPPSTIGVFAAAATDGNGTLLVAWEFLEPGQQVRVAFRDGDEWRVQEIPHPGGITSLAAGPSEGALLVTEGGDAFSEALFHFSPQEMTECESVEGEYLDLAGLTSGPRIHVLREIALGQGFSNKAIQVDELACA